MKNGHKQLQAKVWKPLVKSFNETIERACLRRDAYLDRVFTHEAGALREEIEVPNSEEAQAYLQRELEKLDRVAVNFNFALSTIESINGACRDRKVIRDCFINRVLFLLTAPLATLEKITDIPLAAILGDVLGEHERDFLYQEIWDGSLKAVSTIVTEDPFRAWRNVIDHERREGRDSVPLHSCVIMPEFFKNEPQGAWALNCRLTVVPGSWEASQSLADIFGDPVLKNPKPLKKGGKAK